RVNASVAHRRLERRRDPERDRIDGLDVVVAVDEDGRLSGRSHPLAVHDRMARRLVHLDLRAPRRAEAALDPLPGEAHLVRVTRIGADRRDAEDLLELLEIAVLLVVHVRSDGTHRLHLLAETHGSFLERVRATHPAGESYPIPEPLDDLSPGRLPRVRTSA